MCKSIKIDDVLYVVPYLILQFARLYYHHAYMIDTCIYSDFIWDFGKLPFPTHLGKYFIKIGKIRAKIHGIGKIKAIFGLGMTPIYCLKNGQIKSLIYMVGYLCYRHCSCQCCITEKSAGERLKYGYICIQSM